jgi:hypothetical protein
MDIWVSQHPQRVRELLSNAVLLIDEAHEFYVRDRRYSIFGSPWTPQFAGYILSISIMCCCLCGGKLAVILMVVLDCRRVYQLPSGSLLDAAAIWQRIPQQLDILVTHGPPRGTLDMNAYGQHVREATLHLLSGLLLFSLFPAVCFVDRLVTECSHRRSSTPGHGCMCLATRTTALAG